MTTKRLKRPRDPIQLGKLIVDIATGQIEDAQQTDKDPAASELGRLGGLKGGKAGQKLCRRHGDAEIARNAAMAKYARRHGGDGGKT